MLAERVKRLGVALSVVVPPNVLFIGVIVSGDCPESCVLKLLGLSLLSAPATWGLIRLVGYAIEQLPRLAGGALK